MTDQELATKVHEAANLLNMVIKNAVRNGLDVQLNAYPTQSVDGEAYRVEVEVSRKINP